MRLFIDESGHSGSDLYDANQPILTYAGVWLDRELEESFGSFLAQKHRQHRIQLPGELKGKDLLRSVRGRRLIRDLFVEMREQNVMLSLVAVHKTFLAAAVVVDDCTDYVYNKNFGTRWTWDTRLKEPLAEKILEVAPHDLLSKVWRLRSGDDRELWKKSYESLLFALSLSTDSQLAHVAASMCDVDLIDLWDANEFVRNEKRDYNPNQSAFNALMQLSDQLADKLGFDQIELVHDEQDQYQSNFEYWFSVLKNAGEMHYVAPNGNEIRLPLCRIAELRFLDSKYDIGVRLADIAASASRLFLQERLTGRGGRAQDYSGRLIDLLRADALLGNPLFLIGPESWQFDTMKALLGIQGNI